jgi:hypothetical protein
MRPYFKALQLANFINLDCVPYFINFTNFQTLQTQIALTSVTNFCNDAFASPNNILVLGR